MKCVMTAIFSVKLNGGAITISVSFCIEGFSALLRNAQQEKAI